jgi:predicted metal-dependent hydrolase
MNDVVMIDGLTFRVTRSKRRTTVGLTIERDRTLAMALPENLSLDQASEAVAGRMMWVHQKLAEHRGAARLDVFRQPSFVDGEGFHVLGQHYRLKLVDPDLGQRALPAIRLQGEYLFFRRDRVSSGMKRIIEYYTRTGHPYLNARVERWKDMVGVQPRRFVNVADLGFRWGSCSADGTLNFHWRVMQLPPWVIDYIVVHELAHLEVPAHSPAFWRVVERVLPDYAEAKRWLSDKGGDL